MTVYVYLFTENTKNIVCVYVGMCVCHHATKENSLENQINEIYFHYYYFFGL